MKIEIILTIVLLLVCFKTGSSQIVPSFPENQVWDYPDPDISDSVISLKREVLYPDDDSDSLVTRTVHTYNFSSEGKINKILNYDPETNQQLVAYNFDEFERIIRTEGQSGITNEYVYDDKTMTSKWVMHSDSIDSYIRIKYYYENKDSEPRLILRKRYRSTGELADSTMYTYNDRGHVVRSVLHNTPNGYGITIGASITGDEEKFIPNPSDTVHYYRTYDSNGKITSVTTHRRGRPFKRETFTTSVDTLITRIEDYRRFEEEPWQLEKIIKDVDDQKIEFIPISFSDDIIWTYKNGLRTKTIRLDNDEITEEINTTYQRTYDSRGNWIERRKIRDGELVQIVRREIEYY